MRCLSLEEIDNMTLQPDEDDDVIVHQSRLHFEGVVPAHAD